MLKASFIKIIFINKACIPCLHELLNSFFVFSKWTVSTISKTRLVKTYSQFHSFLYNQNKISTENGILFSDVLSSKLLNNPFVSCSFINLDFVIPQLSHFGFIINLSYFFRNF